MKRKTALIVYCTLLPFLLIASTALADIVTVHVFCCGYSINPKGQPIVEPTIKPGDTIHWVWDEDFPLHSVTSLAGSSEVFDSGVHGQGFTFDRTFNTPGIFKYYCVLHGTDNGDGTAIGMWGTITVVSPSKVSALTFTPASVPGPKAAKGTVTLSAAAPTGGLVVTLSSNNSAAIVPSSITVPAGATNVSFTIKTTAVTAIKKPTISASGGGATVSKVFTVKPPGVKVLALCPDGVAGGTSTIGAVVLDAPAPAGGVTVSLTSSTASAGVPASISIAAGATTGTFAITTTTTPGSPVIKATANGVAKSATLTVLP